MIVKVAPMGEQVVEVNVESGSTVANVLGIANVIVNGRSIAVDNSPADTNTVIEDTGELVYVTLANKMKGGKAA